MNTLIGIGKAPFRPKLEALGGDAPVATLAAREPLYMRYRFDGIAFTTIVAECILTSIRVETPGRIFENWYASGLLQIVWERVMP